jgi:hypothetical protein
LSNLQRALGHVASFRALLGSLTASVEVAQMAKDVLVSLVDSSGLDLSGVEAILAETMRDCKEISGL